MINIKQACGVNEVLDFLLLDEAQNALLVKCILQERADDIQLVGNSISLLDKGSGNYLFSPYDFEEFNVLYNLKKPKTFFMANESITRHLKEGYPEIQIVGYNQWVFDGEHILIPKEIDGVRFRKMELSDLPFVVDTFQSEEFGLDYLACQIEHSCSVCALDTKTGSVIGYTLVHKDCELGPIFILPEYRGRGLGSELLCRITLVTMKWDNWPLAHVNKDNIPSMAILSKMGYKLCSQNVCWCYA